MLDYWPTLNFTMDIKELGEINCSFFLSFGNQFIILEIRILFKFT